MGGGSREVVVQQPAPPQPQSAASSYADYVAMRPQMFAQDVTYAPQYAALEKQINEQLYPYTAGLQESLAKQVQAGMTETAPEWYQRSIADTLKSQLGRNLVYNPLAQEQFGVATNEAYKGWQDYYRNLGLTLAGRQPLAQTYVGTSAIAPQSVLNYNAQNYGNFSNAYSSMYGANAALAGQMATYNPWANVAGSLAGGIGQGLGTGIGMLGMGAMMSSRQYKKNIKLWAKQ